MIGQNLPILLDTQAIVWAVSGNPKLSTPARDAIMDGAGSLYISAVTAFKYVDLNRRGRFETNLPFGQVLEQLEASVLGIPASVWTIAEALPPIHFDPVDRMMIAHAIHADLTLITADKDARKYPVRSI